MDLRDTPEEAAFRAEVRAFIEANLPAGSRERGARRFEDADRDWSRALGAAGYAGLTWPKEYGGAGAPYSHQAIFLEELARAEAPSHLGVIGLGMAGPTIIAWGTEDQKERYLAKILSADEIWCQGFSEPDAGSDLAAARTRIEDKGDHFLVNGQKVWSSFAHIADFCILVGLGAARRAAVQEPHLCDRRHARAGRRGAAARADHRPPGVQRDLLHRRPGAEGEPARRGRRRLAGRDDDAPARAGDAGVRAGGDARRRRPQAARAREGARRHRPDPARPDRARVGRAAGAALHELPRADDAAEDRDPGARRVGVEARLVGEQPAADEARARDPRLPRPAHRRRRRTPTATGSTSSSARAATRSRPAPARSSRNIVAERVLGMPRSR